jgi:Spx/MgsR family transcriptional regulator
MEILTSMAESVANRLKEREHTVAVSESAAGGLISAVLLSVAGASSYFVGGAVVYTRDARRGLLGFSEEDSTMRGSTEDYALRAARSIREKLGTTWGLGESGASGPSGNRYGDNAGHVCVAVAGPVERSITLATGEDDRESNMWSFAASALDFLDATVAGYTGVVTVYGIKNCDTCRKALKWLAERKIEHRFHDLRTDGVDGSSLNEWINELGWEKLLNRRSTTWRQLPEAMQQNVTPVSAASLMLAHPTLIKRPVIDLGGRYIIGFGAEQQSTLEAAG